VVAKSKSPLGGFMQGQKIVARRAFKKIPMPGRKVPVAHTVAPAGKIPGERQGAGAFAPERRPACLERMPPKYRRSEKEQGG